MTARPSLRPANPRDPFATRTLHAFIEHVALALETSPWTELMAAGTDANAKAA